MYQYQSSKQETRNQRPQSSNQILFVNIYQNYAYKKNVQPLLLRVQSQQYTGVFQLIQILSGFKQQNENNSQIQYSNEGRVKSINNTGSYGVLTSIYSQGQILEVFSGLASIILQFEKHQPRIRILQSGKGQQILLSKGQLMYLLALMAFNLVPRQIYKNKHRFNRNKDFSLIFSSQQYKTKCIIEYFKSNLSSSMRSQQKFTIRRQVQIRQIEELLSELGRNQMTEFHLEEDHQSIQEFIGGLKVDFANKFVGGGALTKGCVQEEIMFADHTEMYVSTLLCQAMADNESIVFMGFKKYNEHEGYSYSTKYAGKQDKLRYQYDDKNRANEYITAIDAVQFKNNPCQQFMKSKIDRQIVKAFCGFNVRENIKVATGNWGGGVFKGSLSLKFMIQWIACSMAKKQMIYCPFGKKYEISSNKRILSGLKELSVKQVYAKLLQKVGQVGDQKENIISKMQVCLPQYRKQVCSPQYSNQVCSPQKYKIADQNQSNIQKHTQSRYIYKSTRRDKKKDQVSCAFCEIF